MCGVVYSVRWWCVTKSKIQGKRKRKVRKETKERERKGEKEGSFWHEMKMERE